MSVRYFDNVDWSYNLKVASGTVTATAGDTKTSIKLSSAISLAASANPTNKYLVKIETPINDTAGSATVYLYNRDAIDGTNVRNVIRDTFTVTNVSATSSYGDALVEGLFLGSEETIKIGIAYATDTSSALAADYSIYRL